MRQNTELMQVTRIIILEDSKFCYFFVITFLLTVVKISDRMFLGSCYFFIMTKRGARLKLADVASVRSGLVLSRKLSLSPTEYRYPLLTLRSIRADGLIDSSEVDRYTSIEALDLDYVSHPEDIVIRLSSPYTAVLINEATSGIVISSNFVIVRANRNLILPEYLFWLLNTKQLKQQIFENSSSNMLGAIKPSYFCDIEIHRLSIQDQEKIATMNQLARKECQLLDQLSNEKSKLYTALIDRTQKQMRRGKDQ